MFWQIYNKRLRRGYYNLRAGARKMRGARLFPALALCSALLAGCGLLTPEPEPARPANPTGASGRHDAEAEQLFGKARVLWGRDGICSNPEQAVAYLDSALEIEPTYAEALARRGQALSDLGYHDDAFDDLTRAIRLDPTAEAYAGVSFSGPGTLRGRNGTRRKPSGATKGWLPPGACTALSPMRMGISKPRARISPGRARLAIAPALRRRGGRRCAGDAAARQTDPLSGRGRAGVLEKTRVVSPRSCFRSSRRL